MAFIHDNLNIAKSKISEAALRVHRQPEDVELIVVSKTFSAELIREAVEAGHLLFGENRVQELLGKVAILPSNLRWHLIGHLQSNKVRKVLPVVEAIHSVESLDLARDINRVAEELGLCPKVYLEVNIAEESSKHGFTIAQLESGMEALLSLNRIEIKGFMCVPPITSAPENSRKYFVMLRDLRDKMAEQFGTFFPGLSMGMSGDYTVAIEEGATVVRVGSAIFGGR